MTDAVSERPPASGGFGRLLRVRLGWILAVTATVTAVAGLLSVVQTPTYESQATVVIRSVITPDGPPAHAPSMGTEKEVATSDAVAASAARTLQVPAAELLRGLSVTVPVDADVLLFTYSAADPAEARRRAQGMALAYVNYKRAQPVGNLPEQAGIISPADLPRSPSKPNTMLNIIAGFVFGLVLGLLAALVRDRLDDRVRSASELERAVLPVLEVVPAVRGEAAATAVADAPESALAQLYGLLGEKVAEAARTARTRTVVVTSPQSDDGRAAVAVNLAAALALSGRRMMLVDADFRARAEASDDGRPGLLEVLAGRAPLRAALRASRLPALTLLPVGRASVGAAASVPGDTWAQTSDMLADYADLVVVEAPPVLVSADAVRLGRHGALVLICVERGRTSRTAVDRALQELERSGARVLGCVLTDPKAGRTRRPDRAANRPVPAAEIGLGRLLANRPDDPPARAPEVNGHARLDPEMLGRVAD
jgi:Mrp family chromosome partitioning ATPase